MNTLQLVLKLSVSFAAVMLLISSALAAEKPNQLGEPPTPNLATPEHALRSYWRVRDWLEEYERLHIARFNESRQAGFKHIASLTSGETRRYFERFQPWPRDLVERTIKSVTEETQSKAVVLANARNVSPIYPFMVIGE
jgi:hypothetical protein